MIGKRINDRYEILELIGGGGMAFVYKARDIILERDVAIKVLQPQFSSDEQFIKRFRREAQAATSLAHPNVVNIFDVGEEEDIYYIVMEYVKGPTLKELIQSKGAIPLEETVDIISQVMSAIAHAHANHIIHRDIKPHNILISLSNEAKVTDFGIARAMSSATITHTNSVMGSVHYLSPEQARGGVVNYKSDIYSLGIVLYEMVTGKLPFFGDTAVSIAIKHLQNEVPSPREINPSIPQSIENIILKSTAKDPFHRYASVQEMEEDIATALLPSRQNEPKFKLPQEDDEVTKAIPIIKEGMFGEDSDKTIEVHSKQKTFPPSNNSGEKPPKKKSKKKKWLIAILLFLFFIVGTTVAAFAILPSLLKVEDVDVPNVLELEFDEAEQILMEAGLLVERVEEYHDEILENFVVRQDPAGGSSVKVNTTVTLYVSQGREMVDMINLIGLQRSGVERLLENFAGTEFLESETDEYSEGTIIAQIPEAGTPVIPEEEIVYLTYSVEPTVSLVNLEGYTEQAVREYLNENRLIGKFSLEYHDTVKEGHVISQSPAPFTRLKRGEEVNIQLSKGKKEPDPIPERIIDTFINVDARDGEHGVTYDVKIVYDDSTTDKETIFEEETISESKTYRLSLRVTPNKGATVWLYIDGELKETRPFSY